MTWSVYLIESAGLPIAIACWANRKTALAHALAWAVAAWLAWLVFAIEEKSASLGYLAFCLTACAGIAVLGARRPGVVAWHGVVAGLLVILLLPLAEEFLASGGPKEIDLMRIYFLRIALALGIINYITTRLGLGAVLLLFLIEWGYGWGSRMPVGVLGLTPWLAWLGFAMFPSKGWEGDRKWRDFRDRFGVVWAQRLREQFNRAAANANLPVELRWRGMQRVDGTPLTDADRAASLELLRALMTRFC